MEPDIIISRPKGSKEKSLELQLKETALQEELKKAKQLVDGIKIPSDLKDGLSFLDMKNDTMLSYLIDISNIVLNKCRGQSIEGARSVERICEYRLVLEKSKSIDQKLKYQLNRLLTARETNERMNLEEFDLESDEEQVDILNDSHEEDD